MKGAIPSRYRAVGGLQKRMEELERALGRKALEVDRGSSLLDFRNQIITSG